MHLCLDLLVDVNDNESLKIYFMGCDLILAVRMSERELFSVDILTVNIQIIYLDRTGQHSFTLHSQILFESLRVVRSGDMPHYSCVTQAYSLLLLCFLIKKPFEPTQLTFIIRKSDGRTKFANFLDAIIHTYTTAVRGASLSTSCVIGIFDEIMTFTS